MEDKNKKMNRIELHAHTKMTESAGLISAVDLVIHAREQGMDAVAITDTGNVQAFPEAMYATKADDDFKMIYGMEAYMTDEDGKQYAVTILIRNETGRKNLYRMISDSYLKYYDKMPLIPKPELSKHRDGLLIGSAGMYGKLYQALNDGEEDKDVAEMAKFYDFLEIMPVAAISGLIEDTKIPEDLQRGILQQMNKQLVKAGENTGLPVCATGDVYYLKNDEMAFLALLNGKEDKRALCSFPFLNTEEMMDEFSYLGKDKAEEIVITNTRMIADKTERIHPLSMKHYIPSVPDADEKLKDMCKSNLHRIYGRASVGNVIEERMNAELKAITDCQYAYLYVIAGEQAHYSQKKGYPVSVRGSAGSSFVAFLAGITEVNPLPAHYYCLDCGYVEFPDAPDNKMNDLIGLDLPEKVCPHCGKTLHRDGFNIPVETFMSFHGDRKPDIDFNFAAEIQEEMFGFTADLLGQDIICRGGTVGSIFPNTAERIIEQYYDDKGRYPGDGLLKETAKKIQGVKRGTGKHPGGFMCIPNGDEIYEYTPLQYDRYPRYGEEQKSIITHFDYHALDLNFDKLDILGHNAPSFLHALSEETGVDIRDIPLSDARVLGHICGGENLDGIPEYGTDFVINMIRDLNPRSFSDLMKISGLSHGTDIYLQNEAELLENGTIKISEAISVRDDIMLYLINCGVDRETAFNIMESVRKGKVATGREKHWKEWKTIMIDVGVPEWYITSCEKIGYLFPKAHVASYLVMALKIAWFKVYYPEEFQALLGKATE